MRRPPLAAAVAVAALAVALAPAGGRADDPPAQPAAGAPPADALPAPGRDLSAGPPAPATPGPDLSLPAPAPAASGGDAAEASAGAPLPERTEAQRASDEALNARIHRGLRRGELPMLGLALGGGFPDLATASLLFRPIPSIRFFAGPSWGYVAWGVQGGLVVAPWSSWITPTFSVEGGKLFGTDLSFLAKDSGGVPGGIKPILRRIDYQYVAADLGLELGSPRGFAFYLRLGLSFVSVKANGTATYTSTGDGGATTKITFTDPALHATLPSLKLGFQYWF